MAGLFRGAILHAEFERVWAAAFCLTPYFLPEIYGVTNEDEKTLENREI